MQVKGFRVLLTGAAGFIGSHLGNRLHDLGADVLGYDNFSNPSPTPRKFEVYQYDVRAPVLNQFAADVDVIVHLAALISVDESVLDPRAMFDVNVGGTLNVLEAARRRDIPVVFASSSEVYGTSKDGMAMDESYPLRPRSPYAASKAAGDRMCAAWRDTYGLRVNIVRGFNTYGPGQGNGPYGGVIAKFVRQALAGEPMTIYGDGRQRRDFMWVGDSVEAYLLALQSDWDGPVNFGTGDTVSVNEVAIAIARELGRETFWAIYPWTICPARPGDVRHIQADAYLARRLGWRPAVAFPEGLKRYIEWAKR